MIADIGENLMTKEKQQQDERGDQCVIARCVSTIVEVYNGDSGDYFLAKSGLAMVFASPFTNKIVYVSLDPSLVVSQRSVGQDKEQSILSVFHLLEETELGYTILVNGEFHFIRSYKGLPDDRLGKNIVNPNRDKEAALIEQELPYPSSSTPFLRRQTSAHLDDSLALSSTA
jgi:hypothetical protein